MSDSDDEFIAEDEDEAGPALIKRLRERLKKAVEEKQEYLEGWQRARAEFANYKKDEASLAGERDERTKARLVEELLPALDSFDMALAHAPTKELELVAKQLQGALLGLGIERFGAMGEDFDPRLHEALREVPTADTERDHTIESVHRMGYKAGERIIRPAQVSVWAHKNDN